MSVLSFFTWCESTAIGEAIRDSRWLFPVIECVHLLALALLGGLVLNVNLSLLGLGAGRKRSMQLWSDTRPWLLFSLGAMLASGFLLFLSEAVKLYYHEAFWVKMSALALAMLFTFTVQSRTAQADPSTVTKFRSRAVAAMSLLLWLTVGAGGRWIGFS
jgi:hypothetical protein